MSLETGSYFLTFSNPAHSVGPSRLAANLVDVVTLPLGTRPFQWKLIKLDNGNYEIWQGGNQATIDEAGNVSLTRDRIPINEWSIIRVARDQYPVDEQQFVILLAGQQSQQGWFVPIPGRPNPVGEVQVTAGQYASLIYIKAVSP